LQQKFKRRIDREAGRILAQDVIGAKSNRQGFGVNFSQ
jgi:hypothetical protein